MVAPPRTHTCMVITMTPGIPNPAEIAEVDSFGQIRKFRSTTMRSGGVVSLLRNPLGGHTRGGRERGGEGGAPRGRGDHERLVMELCCVFLSLWGLLYIVGRGAPCPLPKAPRAVARREGG
jgi:hypothetical protein